MRSRTLRAQRSLSCTSSTRQWKGDASSLRKRSSCSPKHNRPQAAYQTARRSGSLRSSLRSCHSLVWCRSCFSRVASLAVARVCARELYSPGAVSPVLCRSAIVTVGLTRCVSPPLASAPQKISPRHGTCGQSRPSRHAHAPRPAAPTLTKVALFADLDFGTFTPECGDSNRNATKSRAHTHQSAQ
eukprot:scaffold52728_cov69-Phaeocystis_antarctica.AAC.13